MRNSGTNKQQYQIDRNILKMSPQMSNSRHQMSNSKSETVNNPQLDHCNSLNQWKMHQVPVLTQAHMNQYLAQQLQNHLKSNQNHLVCTCPPEVHKALLEQQLIQISNYHPHAHATAQHMPPIHFQPCQYQRQVLIKPVVSNSSLESQSICNMVNQLPYSTQIKTPIITSCTDSISMNMTQSMSNNLSMSYPTPSLQQAICHSRQISTPETLTEARTMISKMESQIMYLTSWIQNNFHAVNSLQANNSSTNNQTNYVPPVTESISLSQHKNCLPCYIVTSDCITSDYRDGHVTVEATPSNSSLDSAYSAKSTTSSENNSGFFKLQSTGNCQIPSSPVFDEKLSVNVINKLIRSQEQLRTLKLEIDALKRLNQSFKVAFKNECNESFLKIKKMMHLYPGVNNTTIRNERMKIEEIIAEFTLDVNSEIEKLEDLEIAIEDLRMNVLNRKCRVKIDEVEMLALHLSKISKCLAINKADFPELETKLKQILQTENELITLDEKFMQSEPKRLDSALKLCKKLISTLFTLKRLGSVQENTGSDSIPEIRSNRDPKPKDKIAIFDIIKNIEPDHNYRMQQIEQAEKLRECRRRMLTSHESLKFEKSLELAARTLRDTKLSSASNSGQNSTIENRQTKVSVGSNTKETDSLSSLTDSDVEPIVPKTETVLVNKDLSYKPIPGFIQRLPLINDLNHTSSSDTSNDQDSSDNAFSKNRRLTVSSKLSSKLGSKQNTILKTSQHSSRSNRSSKVAFNRMVTVEDGSEVLQLNCPDDDYDDDLSSMTLTSPPPPPPPRLSSQDETINAPETDVTDDNTRSKNNIWYQQYHNSINSRIPKTES